MGSEPVLNIAHWIPRSAVNGPGERFVLWLQGCPLRCEGCWNPDTWDFTTRTLMTIGDLADRVLQTKGIEGITLTGGEPTIQAEALIPLLERLRETELSVMLYSGFNLEELHWPAARQLLALADLAVLGRFVLSERDLNLRWRGSRNQQLLLISERYANIDINSERSTFEIHLDNTGCTVLTGFPDDAWLEDNKFFYDQREQGNLGGPKEAAFTSKK